jgi:hypothetical protein
MRAVRQIRADAAGIATDTAASRPAFLEVFIHAEETEAMATLFQLARANFQFTNANIGFEHSSSSRSTKFEINDRE